MSISQIVKYWNEHKDEDLADFCRDNNILLFVSKINWGENCKLDDFWKATYMTLTPRGYVEFLTEYNLSGQKATETVISLEDVTSLKDMIAKIRNQSDMRVDACDGTGIYILSYIDNTVVTTHNYCYATATEQVLLDKVDDLIRAIFEMK